MVEVEPCTFADIPDDSVDAIHGLFAGSAQTSERLAVVPLDKLVALDKPEILVRQVQLEIQEPTELAVTVTVERLVKAVQVVVVVPEEELLDIT